MAQIAKLNPQLFIGLGGIGSRIVDQIKRRAMDLPDWEEREALTQFVALDTNANDQRALKQIDHANQLSLAVLNKAATLQNFRDAKNEQATQWLPEHYKPREGVTPGAGQVRLESRIGCFVQSRTIQDRLEQVMKRMLRPDLPARVQAPAEFFVHVYCTVAGGTGSGAFLPMAYLVRDAINQAGGGDWQPHIYGNLLLSTLAVQQVDQALHPDIHANAYAALKELEHLTQLNYEKVNVTRPNEPFSYRQDAQRSEPLTVDAGPFFNTFVYDTSTITDQNDTEGMIADSAFLVLFSPTMASIEGALDNYQKKLGDLTKLIDGVGQGYSKNFGAIGATALYVPVHPLLRYLTRRFAADALRRQITFGVTTDDPTDLRARALAGLAVDYGAPTFSQLSASARNTQINDAFIQSVREMARLDQKADQPEGYWADLVASVDEGRPTGTDPETGEIRRGESQVGRVERVLADGRRGPMTAVEIQKKPLTFLEDNVNQWNAVRDRMETQAQTARQQLERAKEMLKAEAEDGQVVKGAELDPITERYLVLRLCEEITAEWLPAAEATLDAAQRLAVEADAVQEELRNHGDSLQESAGKKSVISFGKKEAFMDQRDQAQEYLFQVIDATRRCFEADLAVAQLRALLSYVTQRADLHARIAREVNGMVADLEQEAEGIRRGAGEQAGERLSRSVEVFETIAAPKERMWSAVYSHMCVQKGKEFDTFEQKRLAGAMTPALEETVPRDGGWAQRTTDDICVALKAALLQLGDEVLRPRVVGMEETSGLTVEDGLMIEAELQGRDDEQKYIQEKLAVFQQQCGVLATTRPDHWQQREDGVVYDSTRYLLHGARNGQEMSSAFLDTVREAMSDKGKKPNPLPWEGQPHLVVVTDIQCPIPLYYFSNIKDTLYPAYRAVQKDPARGHNLHIDRNWEEMLPDLDPLEKERTSNWALGTLQTGVRVGQIKVHVTSDDDQQWTVDTGQGEPDPLGPSLTDAMYQLGLTYRISPDVLAQEITDRAEELKGQVDHDVVTTQQKTIKELHRQIEKRKLESKVRPRDALEQPILDAIVKTAKG